MNVNKVDNNTVGYMTINKIQTREGNYIVCHTNYLHGKVMDKLVQVYNSLGKLINVKYKTFEKKQVK